MTSTIPDDERPPAAMVLRERGMVLGVVVHLSNEQPFTADLFAMPSPTDLTLVCTNVRTSAGKRPVWADAAGSIYYFPWAHIRFIEVPESVLAAQSGGKPRASGNAAGATGNAAAAPGDADGESELEIDEEFLRRVRDV